MATCVEAVMLACLSAPLETETTKETPDAEAARVERMFAQWDRPDVPGCAVAIVQDQRTVYARCFGSANLDYNVPITQRTIFETGSMTKSFTGACVALLLDRGKISADDDIRKYLPEMHHHDPPIRVRHLIRCRSGLWAQWHLVQLAGWSSEPIESPYSADDVYAILSNQRSLPFEPGTTFRYGSSDYVLLARIVQRVTGKSLADFAAQHLFGPLGMTRTRFLKDPTRPLKNRAVGHYRGPDGDWRQWTTNTTAVGGWGLRTCLEDLLRWESALSQRHLPRGKHLDRFCEDGTVLDNRNVFDAKPTGRYRGLKRIQFTGGMPGYHAAMVRFPEQGFAFICLTNNGDIFPWNMADEIADLYLADKFPEPPNDKPQQPASPRFIKLPEKDLRSKVGSYRMNGSGALWRVALKDGSLYWSDHDKNTFPLKPVSRTTFRPQGSGIDHNDFIFHEDGEAKAASFTLRWPRGKLQFSRVKLVTPTVKELGEFAGAYYSDELAVTYRLALRGGRLWLRVGNRGWEPLDPTIQDEFVPHRARAYDSRIFAFQRDPNGAVVGLSVSLFRVKGVHFVAAPSSEIVK